MADLSDAITPAMVVENMRERGIHLSERTLREFARRVGACRIIGKAMFFMPEDIEVLIAAAKPPAEILLNTKRIGVDGQRHNETPRETEEGREEALTIGSHLKPQEHKLLFGLPY